MELPSFNLKKQWAAIHCTHQNKRNRTSRDLDVACKGYQGRILKFPQVFSQNVLGMICPHAGSTTCTCRDANRANGVPLFVIHHLFGCDLGTQGTCTQERWRGRNCDTCTALPIFRSALQHTLREGSAQSSSVPYADPPQAQAASFTSNGSCI